MNAAKLMVYPVQLAQTNLNYFSTSVTEFPTDADVEHDLVQEGAWAAVVIQQDATAALQLARSVGNAAYNGASAVNVYYAQARQETAFGSYLLPDLQQAMGMITGKFNAESVAQ